MELALVNKSSPQEVAEFVQFVYRNYASPLPIDEAKLASGSGVYFWAKDPKTGDRVGATGFIPKTPYLAETVKTVIDQKYRGKGLGEKLSELIEKEVRRQGFKKVM